jgi:hypothetical protein
LAVHLHTIPRTQAKGGNVLRNYVVVTAAVLAGSSLAAAGQSPSPAAQTPSSQQAQSTTGQASTTLTGCVYREKDVPGRAPNVAERAGVLEDYILADVRPASGTAGTTGTTGSTSAKAPMYKLELIEDEKLKAVVGKRVEVTGRIDAESGDVKSQPATPPSTSQTDKALGRDAIDIPEFEVTSIREVTGTCPATPSAK